MPLIPSFLLRRKALVATIAAAAAAGILIAAGAAAAVALRPAARIAALRLDSQAALRLNSRAALRLGSRAAVAYADGDRLLAYIPVLTGPAGQQVTSPAAVAVAGRAFAALAAALPGVRIADYATTHDRALLAPGGRSTYALLYTAPGASFGGSGAGPAISRALAAATPPGWQGRLAEPPFPGARGPWPGSGPGPWLGWGRGACAPSAAPVPRAGHCGPPGPPWAGWAGWAGPPH
jgi:hypothetical protein